MAPNTNSGWSPRMAEGRLRACIEHADFDLSYTAHVRERMEERGIVLADIRHLLSHGQVTEQPEKANEPGCYKCKVCGRTPNSGSRRICAVVVPAAREPTVTVITVMWEDIR